MKITYFNQMPSIQDKRDWPYYHGDCTLIRFDNGETMLIDSSTKYNGAFLVDHMADALGIQTLDYFVASHLHQDHTAAFPYLTERIEVKKILLSGYGYENADTDKSFMETIRMKNIPYQELRKGDSFMIGDARVDVLFPEADAPEADPALPWNEQGALLNWYSLVLRISQGQFSVLMTGDIHEEIEADLVKMYGYALESTVLKLPHHGNSTSTSQIFVDTVNPTLGVVMSTGCEWVVQRKFSNHQIPLYGTFCDGTITIDTDGEKMRVDCWKGQREYPL